MIPTEERPAHMKGCTYLCKDCGAVFVIGPLNMEYLSRYTCYSCSSPNVEHQPDLYDQATIDNRGEPVIR